MATYDFSDFLSRSTNKAFDETTLGKVLKALPPISAGGPWIAGGALRRTLLGQEPTSDFDFFFRDADQLAAFAKELGARGFAKILETEHHAHYRGRVGDDGLPIDVQCIRFAFYQDAVAVVDSFDFTICMFAYDGETLTTGEHSLWDLGRKRLAIHKITYPVSTMRRLLKYGRQGFTACKGCLTQLLRRTAETPELLQQLDVEYVD